jgi:cytochrome c-type biogenesis protein
MPVPLAGRFSAARDSGFWFEIFHLLRAAFDRMNAVDLVFGFLAGIVSCLTPEALLLFPLVIGAARAAGRAGVIASAIGLGLAVILTGALAVSFAVLFGLDAVWMRRIVCLVLILQGIALMNVSMVERFPALAGSASSGYVVPGGAFRQLLLALFVGANWVPLPGPTLGKASLMAADAQNYPLAFGILFVFGVGAALPWIVFGRIIRVLAHAAAPYFLEALASKKMLGLTLIAVAALGISGLDVTAAHWLDAVLPGWMGKLAMTF